MNAMSRAICRFFCCGPGADDDKESSTVPYVPYSNEEPIYENVGVLHQAYDGDAVGTLRLVVESVEEIRRMLLPIADVPERMRRLELNLHPLLVYRPEEGEYMDMRSVPPRPAPAAPPAPCSVYVAWLRERIDYGEPW